MSRKAFHIAIDLDIHAVTCPGVWLCPKGSTMLKISMLGTTACTKKVGPIFPLLFHENFHFRKTLTAVTSLAELEAELHRRLVYIQLLQWQVHGCRCVLLAAFCSPLSELLYPQQGSRGLISGVDVDLLMEATSCFPGIISPKVEVSTKVVIEEMLNYPLHDKATVMINPKTLPSKRTGTKKEVRLDGKCKGKSKLCGGPRLRQKPVCHTKPRVRCNSCKQRPECRERAGGALDDSFTRAYCFKCGEAVPENDIKQGKVVVKEGFQGSKKWEGGCPCVDIQSNKSTCECSLCQKYNILFNNPVTSPTSSAVSHNFRFKNWKCDEPTLKDRCCSGFGDKLNDDILRLRGSTTTAKCGCSRQQYPAWAESPDLNGNVSSMNHEYKALFKADLDTHYKKLYERVSKRHNSQPS